MITLYDYPSGKLGRNVCWNPHLLKVRYALNYKGLPYKTIWLEYPDVGETMKKIGVKPTGLQPGTEKPWYTLPAIVDDSTGVAMAESIDIVEYLDNTYPDTPRVVPEGTHALQVAFSDNFFDKLPLYMPFIVPSVAKVMNPRSAEHFCAEYETLFGKPLEQVFPEGNERVSVWKKWIDTIGTFDAWMKKDDIWVMGDRPSYADFILGSFILSAKMVFGEESKEYREVLEVNNGRWDRLAQNLEKYSQVN